MASSFENAGVVSLRTADPVQNLALRVKVRRRKRGLLGKTQDAPSGSTGRSSAEGSASSATLEVAWQQKVFGPRELVSYGGLEDSVRWGVGDARLSTLQKHYRKEAQELLHADGERATAEARMRSFVEKLGGEDAIRPVYLFS